MISCQNNIYIFSILKSILPEDMKSNFSKVQINSANSKFSHFTWVNL